MIDPGPSYQTAAHILFLEHHLPQFDSTIIILKYWAFFFDPSPGPGIGILNG